LPEERKTGAVFRKTGEKTGDVPEKRGRFFENGRKNEVFFGKMRFSENNGSGKELHL